MQGYAGLGNNEAGQRDKSEAENMFQIHDHLRFLVGKPDQIQAVLPNSIV